MGVRQGRQGGKVDKGEKEKRTIKTHEDLVIYQKAFNGEKSNTVKQRLKEWYQDSNAKKGKKRRELDVTECFAPLLKWILRKVEQ